MGFFGDLASGVGDIITSPAAGALANFIPGVGPLASTAIGAIGGALGGGGAGGALQGGLMGGMGGYQQQAMEQMKKDQEQARQMAQKASDRYDAAVQGSKQRYGMNAPLRDAFRSGLLNSTSPYNPFARDLFSGFAENLTMESDKPEDQGSKGKKPGKPTKRSSTIKQPRNNIALGPGMGQNPSLRATRYNDTPGYDASDGPMKQSKLEELYAY